MAYFQHRPEEEASYTRQFHTTRDNPPPREEWEEEGPEEYDGPYDDGFDELEEEEVPEEEISEEELQREKRQRYRVAAGYMDFAAVLIGVLVILALVAFLSSMIRFVSLDFKQTFSLWQTRL